MFSAVDSPYLVPFDGSFSVTAAPSQPAAKAPGKKQCKALLKQQINQLDELQRLLYAHDHHAILLIFQAMDAAGKDGTIRAVMNGIDPSGCQVFSFKQPSGTELEHDFLWRTNCALPERGRIGIFNRSYYEEVLIVRVHPELLAGQRLPFDFDHEHIWEHRYESIRDLEKHLARNGTVILKFWLNVSNEEQRRRFLSRIDEPEKNWKFSSSDIRERQYWDVYMQAYETALNTTSAPWAPWYAIPADNKPYMRLCVAQIIVSSLQQLNLSYPRLRAAEKAKFREMRKMLTATKSPEKVNPS